MTYVIELGDPSSPTVIDRVASLNLPREHTALSDFRAEVPIDLSLETHVFDDVRIYWRQDGADTLLFRGRLEQVRSAEKQATTRLGGPDVVHRLENQARTGYTVTDQETWKAIRDFWNSIGFVDATVKEPAEQILDSQNLLDLDTSTDFQNAASPGATEPVQVNSGALEPLQTCYHNDATDGTDQDFGNGAGLDTNGTYNASNDADTSNSAAFVLDSSGAYVEFDYSTEYDIPANEVTVALRIGNPTGISDGPAYEVSVDGTVIGGAVAGFDLASDWSWIQSSGLGSDLSAGSHTVRIEITDSDASDNDDLYLDRGCLLDGRFGYTFDNQVDADFNLAGPGLYPDGYAFLLDELAADLNVVGFTIDTTWNDTTDGQAVGGSYDGSNLVLGTNTTTKDDDDRTQNTTTIFPVVRLGRYGSGRPASEGTPTANYLPQRCTSLVFDFDGSTRSVIESKEFEGTDLEIAQKLHELAGMRFTVEYDESDPVFIRSYAPGEVQRTQDWDVNDRQRRLDVRDYANRVTVRGRLRDDGTRPIATVDDDNGINQYGVVLYDDTDSSLTTLADVKSKARTLLTEKVDQDRLKASFDIAPELVRPGYDYQVTWPDGTQDYVTSERVTFRISDGSSSARVKMDPTNDFVDEVQQTRAKQRDIQDAT